jgi:hypothetical protein
VGEFCLPRAVGRLSCQCHLVAGREAPEPGHEPVAVINGVSPHYFETVGTRVLSGRTFNQGDDLTSPKVFVINQAMADGLFAGEDPLGRRIAHAGGDTIAWGEIVGVVADVESVYPDRTPVAYQLYQPIAQEPRHFAQIAVRTAGIAPASLVESIRTTMASLDPDLPEPHGDAAGPVGAPRKRIGHAQSARDRFRRRGEVDLLPPPRALHGLAGRPPGCHLLAAGLSRPPD